VYNRWDNGRAGWLVTGWGSGLGNTGQVEKMAGRQARYGYFGRDRITGCWLDMVASG
jgi:hypothetical protein